LYILKKEKELNCKGQNKRKMPINVKTKQWGNSIGIIIPSEIVKGLRIKADEEISVDFKNKGNVLKDLYGSLKFKRNTYDVLKEVRKELGGLG